MTDIILEQDLKVVSELERRFKLMMDNFDSLSPIESGATGSAVRFRTTLAPIGYPFVDPPSFMDEEYLKPCMTDEEFSSVLYDSVFDRLFEQVPQKY
tara:strand:- start:240 stop:530 length:291 start_codon:yes stop_codon:yes gene_type:complete